MEELRQLFLIANLQEKLELLTELLDYGENGIDFLINNLSHEE